MKIVITGVNGFVGKHLFHFLSGKHDVAGLYHSGNALAENCFAVDLTDEEATLEVFESKIKNADVIIHLASRLASPGNTNDTSVFYDNVKMTEHVIKACSSLKVKHLIYFSSSAVYPNITGTFSENSEVDPSKNADCIYGLAKFNGEVISSFLLKKEISVTNLRVGYVYGDGMYANRIHSVFEEELLSKNTITVFGMGKRVIPQISIESLLQKLNIVIDKKPVGTFNVCDENISLEDLARSIIERKGNSESRIVYKSEGNQSEFRMDCSKFDRI